VVEKLKN